MACRAWLAWQDGQPDEVIRLADQITSYQQSTINIIGAYRWVYLFPLIAVRLGAGSVNEAVTAARQLLDPAQQALPGDLAAALEAAGEAWDHGEPGLAGQHLESALLLARDRNYF
jgi:hypothetical protein